MFENYSDKSVDTDLVSLEDYEDKWLDYFHRCFKESLKIEGLPKTIRSTQLVDWLWYYGSALIFKPTKFAETPWIAYWAADKFNVYSLPYSAKPVVPNSNAFPGFDARSRIVDPLDDDQEAVILFTNPALYYGNVQGMPALSTNLTLDATANMNITPAQIMMKYAYQMAQLDKLQVQNTILNSHPFIINASGANDQNARLLVQQLSAISPAAIQSRNAGKAENPLTQLQIIKLDGVTWNVENIINAKKILLDEAYGYLGISHASYEKNERLNKDEVNVGVEQSSAYADSIKDELTEGFTQIQKVFKENWRITEDVNDNTDAERGIPDREERDQSGADTKDNSRDSKQRSGSSDAD